VIKRDTIIKYLIETYSPDAIIMYGSFVDGSANEHSDFDALVIANSSKKHDSSVIEDIPLDVFIYPPEVFQDEYNPEDFIQVFDGEIVLDKKGIAKSLKERVLEFIKGRTLKTNEEIQNEVYWLKKMLMRTSRGDTEGYYRWHWLLYDSLEIYFDIKRLRYCGPKKALRTLHQIDPEAYHIYLLALKEFTQETLSGWIDYLEDLSLV
jgi:predicted nucleotidyltransferase